MAGEQNMAVVRRVIEGTFNGGRVGGLDEPYAADCREHQIGALHPALDFVYTGLIRDLREEP